MPNNMKYDQVSAKATGSGKKKGPAESKYLSEPGDVAGETAQKNEGAPPRKKGSAQEKDPTKIANKIAKGKAEAKKGAVQKDVMMDENMSGGGRKKSGAAKPKLERKKDKLAKTKEQILEDPTRNSKKSKRKLKKYNKTVGQILETKGSAKHIDGTDKGHGDKPDFPDVDGDGDKDESLKKAAEEQKNKNKKRKTAVAAKPGASRMGFTQNFGPARQNSYARGAAKVAKIMGYSGAGDAQGGKPHTHSGVEIGSGATNELQGVTLSPKKNIATKIYQSKDFTKPLPDTQIKVPSSDGPKNAIVKNYETKNFGSNFNSVDQLKQGGFLGVPAGSGFSSGNPKNQQNRTNMLTEFTNYMNEPTSSPRRVTQKLNEMKSGPQGGLISDIKFYGGGKKKHKKKY